MNKYRNYSEDWLLSSKDYGEHVSAMTSEKLHSKSDIAAELAWRDEQLTKTNERVKELERELKESDDDLCVTQKQSSKYEAALEEVQSIFVDNDACPLFEPFDAKNLSNWLNKFAIEKKIEAVESLNNFLLNEYDFKGDYSFGFVGQAIATFEEQLRKEQVHG
ncbi:MAG: hypothetical protein AXW14_08620 [Alteromonas sp. Nap_26]|nr:MAG: hypothetical protein AXW14_08620 [Alteromonas sp. Nap_26]